MISRIYQQHNADCLNACVASMTGLDLTVLNEQCPGPADLQKFGLFIVEINARNREKGKSAQKLGFAFPVPKDQVYFCKEVIVGTMIADSLFHAVVGEIIIDHGKETVLRITHDPDSNVRIDQLPDTHYNVVSILIVGRTL